MTPLELAAGFAKIPGHDVGVEAVSRDTWQSLFISQGMKNPMPRIHMLDGFNQRWIDFEQSAAGTRKGKATVETVLQGLIEQECCVSGPGARTIHSVTASKSGCPSSESLANAAPD